MKTLLRAQEDALKDAKWFGIDLNPSEITTCEILENQKHDFREEYENDDTSVLSPEEQESTKEANLDKYVQVLSPDGITRLVRKSTFVWMLTDSKGKLSSDRLKRVQTSNDTNPRKKIKFNDSNEAKRDKQMFTKSDFSNIGEWALFLNSENTEDFQTESNLMNSHFIENILGFRKINEKGRQISYKLDIAPTKKQNIEVLISGYSFHNGKMLIPNNEIKFAIHIKNYVATMKNPI